MQNPISVKIDLGFSGGAAYVCYKNLEEGSRVWRTERLSEEIAIDYDGTGDVLGIEVLHFGDEALDVARRFATSRGLGWCRDLAGAAQCQ